MATAEGRGDGAAYQAVCVVMAGNASTDAAVTARVRDDVSVALTEHSDVYAAVTRAQLEELCKLRKWKTDAASMMKALRVFLAADAARGETAPQVLKGERVAAGVAEEEQRPGKRGRGKQLDEATINRLLGRDVKPKRNPQPRPPQDLSRIVLLHDFPKSVAEAEALLAKQHSLAMDPDAENDGLSPSQLAFHAVVDLRRTYDGPPAKRLAALSTQPTPEELGVPAAVADTIAERQQEVAGEVIDFGDAPPPEPVGAADDGDGDENKGSENEEDGLGATDDGAEEEDGGLGGDDGGDAEEGGDAEAGGDAGDAPAEGEKQDEAEIDDMPPDDDDDEDDSDVEPEPEPEPEPELVVEEEVEHTITKAGVDMWREAANGSHGESLWHGIDFADITIDDFRGVTQDFETLVPALHTLLVTVAKDRLRYQRWSTVPTTQVPEEAKSEDAEALLAAFSAVLDDVPSRAVDVPAALFALREAVALVGDVAEASTHPAASDEMLGWASALETRVMVEEGDAALQAVCTAAHGLGKAPRDLVIGSAVADTVDGCEEYAAVPLAAAVRSVTTAGAYPGAPYRRGMPREPLLTQTDRGAASTELATFTPLPEFVVTRTQLLRSLEGLLQAADDTVAPPQFQEDGKRDPDSFQWKLHNWRWYQARSATAMQQAYADALCTDPEVHSTYVPHADTLLLAIHHPTPRVRHRDTVFSALEASTVPRHFARWKGSGLAARPDWADEPPTFFDVSEDLRESVRVTRRLYPSDHSLIRLQRAAEGSWWLTVHKDGHQFGMRRGVGPRAGQGATLSPDAAKKAAAAKKAKAAKKAAAAVTSERGFGAEILPDVNSVRPPRGGSGQGFPYVFYAHFGATRSAGWSSLVVDEGPACPSKPDGKGSVLASNTTDTGLVVSNCSAGWVRQVPAQPIAWTASGPKETSRMLVGCYATTVVCFEGGYRKILYADGSVAWFLPDGKSGDGADGADGAEEQAEPPAGKWVIVEPSGARYVRLGDKRVSMDPVTLRRTVDPETKADVAVRHDPCPITGAGAAGGLDRMKSKRSKSRSRRGANKAKSKRKQAERDAAIAKYWEERKVLQGAAYTASAPDGGMGGRVVVVNYANGNRLVIHTDGTHIATSRIMAANARPGDEPVENVVVSCPGYATVQVNVATERVAQRHAAGKRVSITRSGNQTRSVTYLPNGTIVANDYDTKITSTVNGRLRVHKPDGVLIIAKDGGTVEYRPAGESDSVAAKEAIGCGNVEREVAGEEESADADGRATPRSVRSEVDTDTGAYTLDLEVGDMRVTDPESNGFQTFMTGHVVTDLAGTIGGMGITPRIGNPIPPRLFTLDGAGGAAELLPPSTFRRLRDHAIAVDDTSGFFPLLVYTAEESDAAARPPTSPTPGPRGTPAGAVSPGGSAAFPYPPASPGTASRPATRTTFRDQNASRAATRSRLASPARASVRSPGGRSSRRGASRPATGASRPATGAGAGAGAGAGSVAGGTLQNLAATRTLMAATLPHPAQQSLTAAAAKAVEAALGTAGGGVPPAFVGRTVALPPTIAPSSYTRTSDDSVMPNASLNHTLLTLSVGPGDGTSGGAAAAPLRRQGATLQHSTGVARAANGRAGLLSADGRTVLHTGTQGWIGYLSEKATPEAGTVVVPSVVAARPVPCGATRVAVTYREVVEHDQLDAEQRQALEDSEAKCEQWRKDVAATINRFAVDDHRPDDVRVEEIMVARRIMKQRAPKKKKKRGRRRYGGGGGGGGGGGATTPASSSVVRETPATRGVTPANAAATPTIMESVHEEPRGAAASSSTLADGGALDQRSTGLDGGASKTQDDASGADVSAPPMTDAQRREAARRDARQRARRRAMERTQKRRGDAGAGGPGATVGSFWRTAAGQEMSATLHGRGGATMDSTATSLGSGDGEFKGRDSGVGGGSKEYDDADDADIGADVGYGATVPRGAVAASPEPEPEPTPLPVAAGGGMSAVRRLSSRNLTAGGSKEEADARDGARLTVTGYQSARSMHTTLDRQPFSVTPRQASFGDVQAGSLYRFAVKLHNTSVDTARFRISVDYITHRPSGNSLRLLTTQPGKVAPGMRASVDVELYARALGSVSTAVEVATEAGVLSIPVTARVQRRAPPELSRGVRLITREDAAAQNATLSSTAYGGAQATTDSSLPSGGYASAGAGGTTGGLTAAEQYLAPLSTTQQTNQTLDDQEAEERMLRLLRQQ